jgi:endonuclease/exonuclease/phosphatase (EEP) superfamily protein YafD
LGFCTSAADQPVTTRGAPLSSPPTIPPARGWRRIATRFIAVGGWLSLALVVAAWIMLRDGDLWAPATALMFGPRWVVGLPALALVPAAAWLRRRSLVPALLAVILTVGPVMGFNIPWGGGSSDSSAGVRLRLMTCNMHFAKVDPGPLARLLDESRPDVIAIQELRDSAAVEKFAPAGWQVHRSPGHLLLSRFPVRKAQPLGAISTGPDGSVMRYDLDLPGGGVTVFSLHFATPRHDLEHVAEDGWEGLPQLALGSALRRMQSEHVARAADDVSGPVLLLGDFNTPTESATFRRVWARYTDAFTAAGWGWGYTFRSRRVAVRIDHILLGPGFRCERSWVAVNVGSPHRPVLADVVW